MAPSSDILPLLGCHDADQVWVWVWVMGFLLMVLFWVEFGFDISGNDFRVWVWDFGLGLILLIMILGLISNFRVGIFWLGQVVVL